MRRVLRISRIGIKQHQIRPLADIHRTARISNPKKLRRPHVAPRNASRGLSPEVTSNPISSCTPNPGYTPGIGESVPTTTLTPARCSAATNRSTTGNPSFATVLKVARALGLELHFKKAAKPAVGTG
jgi:hypothetical protein